MKHITKPKITKKQRAAIILAAALLVLIAVSVPLGVWILRDEEDDVVEYPEILEGEARQGGSTLAYPAINERNQIEYIRVENEKGSYGFFRTDGESYFTMYYTDGNGNSQVYYPEILSQESAFNYSALFAVEDSDGFSQYTMFDYLCLGLRLPYFYERIPLEESADGRDAQLKEYGLTEDKMRKVEFTYTDEFGEKVYRTVKIGEKNISGTGYYFMIDDREYVYSSSNNYYDYAVNDFSSFVKALVVAEGLSVDKGYGPYLATGYYQWENLLHECKEESHGSECEPVAEDSRVVLYADRIFNVISDGGSTDGYSSSGYDVIEIDLEKLKNDKDYSRAIKTLVGARLGKQAKELVFTVPDNSSFNFISFGDRTSVKYKYTVTAIEGFLSDSVDVVEPGRRALDDYDVIKITYTCEKNGEAVSSHPLHAVMDLKTAPISAETAEKIRNAPTGELENSEYITFEIDYTPENAISVSADYTITDVIVIYGPDDKEISKIKSDSFVAYRYAIDIDGVVVETGTDYIDMAKATAGMNLDIKNALLGKGVSTNLDITFDSCASAYYEHLRDFSTYKVDRIDYFVTKELISAFRYQNSSERDPYYGESLYENLMTDEHRLYGLNASMCETVVKILGGLSEESTTATAAGLSGDKVLAVGLTPEVMKRYGLYAHTIYFELPRYIKAYTSDNSGGVLDNLENDGDVSDQLDDYSYLYTIGFTIYISDVDPVTNTRYIASDLYDVVTSVDADEFVFLDHSFEELWARRNLVLMDTNEIESIELELKMQDVKGSYLFDLIHENAKYENAYGQYIDFNKITVFVTPAGECNSSKLTELMSSLGYKEGISLTELYEYYYPNDEELKINYPDSLGTSYFKDAIRMIYLTRYVDLMAEDDRTAAMSEDKLVMKMTLDTKSSGYDYVYEFYRADDRRILVSLYQIDANGNKATEAVSDFYISTFAFKKIVTNFTGLLNAEKINADIGYPDETR